jgi:hypothetical protein
MNKSVKSKLPPFRVFLSPRIASDSKPLRAERNATLSNSILGCARNVTRLLAAIALSVGVSRVLADESRPSAQSSVQSSVQAPGNPPANPMASDVGLDELLEQLQSDRFETRQQAFLELWKTQISPIDSLDSVLENASDELAANARWLLLLRKIGMSRETIEESLENLTLLQVEDFYTLKRLAKDEKWTELLVLWQLLSPTQKETLLENVSPSDVTQLMVTAIYQDRLELLPVLADLLFEPVQALSARRLWVMQGLEGCDPANSIHADTPVAQVLLSEWSGDIEQAATMANQRGIRGLDQIIYQRNFAWSALLGQITDSIPSGDPADFEMLVVADVEKAAKACLLADWLGRDEAAEAWSVKLKSADLNRFDKQTRALALFACGQVDAAVELLKQNPNLSTLELLNLLGRENEAFELAGFDPNDAASFDEWLAKTRGKLEDNPENSVVFDLAAGAGSLLARLGDRELSTRIDQMLSETMANQTADRSDARQRLIRIWLSFSRTEFAMEQVAEMAASEADNGRRNLLLTRLFESNDVFSVELVDYLLERYENDWLKAFQTVEMLSRGVSPDGDDADWIREALDAKIASSESVDRYDDSSGFYESLYYAAMNRGDYALALRISQLGYSFNAIDELAHLYAELEEFDLAEQQIRELDENYPEGRYGLVQRARWLAIQGQYREADQLRENVQLYPLPQWNQIYFLSRLQIHQFDESASEFGSQMLKYGDEKIRDRSLIAYRTASILESSNPKLGLETIRIAQCDQLTSLNLLTAVPIRIVLYSNLASRCAVRAAIEEGNFERADAAFKTAVQLRPNDIDLAIELLPLADAKFGPGKCEDWFDAFYQSHLEHLADWPNDAMFHNNLAWLCGSLDRKLDVALKHARLAVELSNSDPTYIDTLGEVEFRRGNVPEALRLAIECRNLNRSEDQYQEQIERFTKILFKTK